MNIGLYLQRFQNSINSLFHIKSETSAPIIISIGIFILGFLFTELTKGITRRNKRKITRKIFFQALDTLVHQIANQGKVYSKFSENIKFRTSEQGGEHALQRIELYQITVIKQIEYNNLFTAFFTGLENVTFKKCQNKRIKAFNKIWSCIESAKTWQEINNSQNTLLVDLINDANFKREMSLQDYFEFITPQIFDAGRNKEVQKSTLGFYLLEVANIRYKWEQLIDKTNPTTLHENLVIPIMQLDDKYKKDLSIVVTSSTLLQKSSSSYMEMQRIMNSFKTLYFQQGISFKLYSRLISVSKKYLV